MAEYNSRIHEEFGVPSHDDEPLTGAEAQELLAGLAMGGEAKRRIEDLSRNVGPEDTLSEEDVSQIAGWVVAGTLSMLDKPS